MSQYDAEKSEELIGEDEVKEGIDRMSVVAALEFFIFVGKTVRRKIADSWGVTKHFDDIVDGLQRTNWR